jgi:hypothetical protein
LTFLMNAPFLKLFPPLASVTWHHSSSPPSSRLNLCCQWLLAALSLLPLPLVNKFLSLLSPNSTAKATQEL